MIIDSNFLAVVEVVMLILMVLLLLLLVRSFIFMRAAQRESEEHSLALFNALQKMHSTMNEQLGEQRRQMRAVQELLQLKQAEMTGDFEVVEEEITAPAFSEIEPPPVKKHPLITL